jgi:hypothetical protein
MTSPEESFFLHCRFCQQYFPTMKVRDITFVKDNSAKFTCNKCNYRVMSKLIFHKEVREDK